jgi:membrane protein YqaA with SNARE-associated domain
VPLPPLPVPKPGEYLCRIFGTLIGLVIGLFGGFFGGGAVAFNRNLWAVVPFLTLFVGGILGSILGYAIGAAVGRLSGAAAWKPKPSATLEEQTEARRRSGWTLGCGCVGWFAGFLAGGLLFMAIDMLFGIVGMGPGVAVLFFGFPVVGMIVGFLLFAKIGSRIARRRKP